MSKLTAEDLRKLVEKHENEAPENFFCDKIVAEISLFIQKHSVSDGAFEKYSKSGNNNSPCFIKKEKIFGKEPQSTLRKILINSIWGGSNFDNEEDEKYTNNYFDTARAMSKKIERGLVVNGFKITYQNYIEYRDEIKYIIEW